MEIDKIQEINQMFAQAAITQLRNKPYLLVCAIALNPDADEELITCTLDPRIDDEMLADLCTRLLMKIHPERCLVARLDVPGEVGQ